MNDIHTKDKRNLKTALFYSQLLHFSYLLGSFKIEESAYLSSFYFVCHVAALCLTGDYIAGNRQIELTYFLSQGHLTHQTVYECIYLWIVGGRG